MITRGTRRALARYAAMRALILLAPALFLAACGGGNDDANNAVMAEEAAEMANMPAPTTPQLNVTAATNEEDWIAPQNGAGDPTTAPYGNVLDEPVVDAPSKTR